MLNLYTLCYEFFVSNLRYGKILLCVNAACDNFKTAVVEVMLQKTGLMNEVKRCCFMLSDGHFPPFRKPLADQLSHENCNTQHMSESQNNKRYSQMSKCKNKIHITTGLAVRFLRFSHILQR